MSNAPHFPSLMTAMATPFSADGHVDLDGAQRLAAHLVDTGSGGIVVAGTTGESPTLNHDETVELIRAVIEAVGDRATIVAGTGKNDTAATITMTDEATSLGVDGVMIVAPYYNRPNQRGLDAHFRAAAAATPLPVIVYDVPGRTGTEIAADTVIALAAEVENVVALKDAAGNLAKASRIIANVPEGFQLLSGDDASCLPHLAVGSSGIISVAAHLVGEPMAEMIRIFPNDPSAARAIHLRLGEIFRILFAEPSPAPLKAALTLMGLPAGELRPPLCPIADDTLIALKDAMHQLELI